MFNKKGLHFKEKTTWKEVWNLWQDREGKREEWQKLAKEKGWQSWEKWRDAWVSNIGLQNREWERYIVNDPLSVIPTCLVGPTTSWQNFFSDKKLLTHTFAELIEEKGFLDRGKNNKIQAIQKQFPVETEFIGIVLSEERIMIIEGHHRAAAITLAKKQGTPLEFTSLPTIALTCFDDADYPLLEDMLRRGSGKQ